MKCVECEEIILEALETSLAAGQRAELEAHVAICPSCRQFQQAQRQLDAALVKSLSPPRLSADFSARVLRRVDEELARVVSADVEARKRAAEAEYTAGMAALRGDRSDFRVLRMLDLVGLGVVGLLVGLLLSLLVSWLPSFPLPHLPATWQGSMVYVSWAVAVLVVGVGLTLGRRRDLLARLRV